MPKYTNIFLLNDIARNAKQLSKPVLGYCQLDPQKQSWVKFHKKQTKIFINNIASESIICEMAAIFSRGDKLTWILHSYIVSQVPG